MVQLGDGLSIGAEYNYVDLEKRTYGVEIVAPGDVADIDHMIHVFKVTGTVRLNPLFGGF